MAGHSKWANIRHRKDRQDQKKGKIWSKCSKALMAAARTGGADPDTNLALRYAIDEAKYANMPKDTIKRAITKGAGAGGGDNYEEASYEGYGPGGVAIIVDALTDNKTRTVGDLRNIFKKSGGTLGSTGSVSFMFTTRGQIFVEGEKYDEDAMMDLALEAGAEDVEAPGGDGGFWVITTDPTEFQSVKVALEAAGVEISEAGIAKVPNDTQELRGDKAVKFLKLVDAIEDNDDVQKVFTSVDIPDDELEGME